MSESVCPKCGHCPTCGRSNFVNAYPYWPYRYQSWGGTIYPGTYPNTVASVGTFPVSETASCDHTK